MMWCPEVRKNAYHGGNASQSGSDRWYEQGGPDIATNSPANEK
ncbi:MAG: hypothetical protein ACMG55_16960 [Microcoleus sp.]